MSKLTQRAVTYLEVTLNPVIANNGWVECTCPTCGKHRKLGINYAEARHKCWSCAQRGSLITLVGLISGIEGYAGVVHLLETYEPADIKFIDPLLLSTYRAKKRFLTSTIPLPDGFIPLYLAHQHPEGDHVLGYLKKIGLDQYSLSLRGFGFVPLYSGGDFAGRLIIPFYKDHQLVYFIGRALYKSNLRYKNYSSSELTAGSLFYNQDVIKGQTSIDLVEGWADAETLGNKTAIAYLSSSLTAAQWQILYESNLTTLVFYPDANYYGSVVRMCIDHIDRFEIIVVDTSPLWTATQKDVNDWGFNKCMELRKIALPLQWSNLFDVK